MSLENDLRQRSNNQCELCKSESNLSVYELPPNPEGTEDGSILICDKCSRQLNKKEEPDSAHWSCLKESMWSEVPAVQIVTWRMLNRLRSESWAAEALDMMYLDEAVLNKAKATGDHENSGEVE